jgi:alpha-beta hydrolase superfamily lysophospholipase
VLLYDVRGHGKTLGTRGTIDNFKTFTLELEELVTFVKEKYELKVFLLGHSMGGLISSATAIRYQNVDGLITSAMPITTPKKMMSLRWWPNFILGKKITTNFKDPRLSSIGPRFDYDPYGLTYFRLRLIKAILVDTVRYIRKNHQKLDLPCLVLHGTDDTLVDSNEANKFLDLIVNYDKELIKYDKARHNLFHEHNTDQVIKDIIAWLERH